MSALTEPFAFEFFRNGIVVATIAGAVCGLIGVYVVLRGMSYIGHGLSHAVFGGAVASYTAGFNFYLGAGGWGVASALLINALSRSRRVGADAAIGVVTTASFAAGVALISRRRAFTRDFEAALFGDVLGVSGRDIAALGIVAALTGAIVFFRYRALLFSAFDPEVAAAAGVGTARIDALLSVMLAGVIVATLPVLGVTMVAAALVTPPAAARLVTSRFTSMIGASVAMGAAAGAVGMYLSYYLDLASGAAVVLTSAAFFGAAFAAGGARRGATAPAAGN